MRRVAVAGALVLLVGCGSSTASGIHSAPTELTLTSPDLRGAFAAAMTCDGANQAPHVAWSGTPGGTRGFVLEMTDQDAGNGSFTHWLVYEIPAGANSLGPSLPARAVTGRNDLGGTGYGGPCPPKGSSAHHYTIAVYALDADPGLAAGKSRVEVEDAIQAHVIATGTLEATYQRQ